MARPRARRRIPRGLTARVVACACAGGTATSRIRRRIRSSPTARHPACVPASSSRFWPASAAASSSSIASCTSSPGTTGPRICGVARRRSARPEFLQSRHRPSHRSTAREHARLPHGRRSLRGDAAAGDEPPRQCDHVTASPLVGGNKEVHGVILLMEEQSTPARVN